MKRMNVTLIFISTGLLLIATSVQCIAAGEKNSLGILVSLHDGTYAKDEKVKIRCKVKHATSYYWYKNDELLNKTGRTPRVTGRKLVIQKFDKTDEGLYVCEGRNKDGNFGRTAAKLTFSLLDPACEAQKIKENETECSSQFDDRRCPKDMSFAPTAENMDVQIKIDYRKWPYDVYFLISWQVSRKGKDSIWGWQIRIFGRAGNAIGYQMCKQINTKYSALENETKLESAVLVAPASAYDVQIQGLPSYSHPHNETVVVKSKNVPGLCEMVGAFKKACCESFVNASLGVVKHNRTTLFWTTHYPARLNVTIDAFMLKWISTQNSRCDANAVLVDASKFNYTFPALKRECGNYTIKLEVMFSNNKELECERSPAEELLYIPPPVPTTPPSKEDSNGFQAVATAAFTIAAIFGGIVIVAVIYLWRKRGEGKRKAIGCSSPKMSTENVRVFILNPNHCDLCTEVVQTLGSLLIETGRIRCEIDMFAPMREKCQGLARWTQDMILSSDYVIIPWMCEVSTPKHDNTVTDMNTLLFLSSLDIIHGELVRNPKRKDKFIPVCLDHCSLEILPANQVLLQTYNIPSKIDDLVIELLGETRRKPDTKWPLLEFDDKDYISAKRNLEQAVNKMKKHHRSNWRKSFGKFPN